MRCGGHVRNYDTPNPSPKIRPNWRGQAAQVEAGGGHGARCCSRRPSGAGPAIAKNREPWGRFGTSGRINCYELQPLSPSRSIHTTPRRGSAVTATCGPRAMPLPLEATTILRRPSTKCRRLAERAGLAHARAPSAGRLTLGVRHRPTTSPPRLWTRHDALSFRHASAKAWRRVPTTEGHVGATPPTAPGGRHQTSQRIRPSAVTLLLQASGCKDLLDAADQMFDQCPVSN